MEEQVEVHRQLKMDSGAGDMVGSHPDSGESQYCVSTEKQEGGEVSFVVLVSACPAGGGGMDTGSHLKNSLTWFGRMIPS